MTADPTRAEVRSAAPDDAPRGRAAVPREDTRDPATPHRGADHTSLLEGHTRRDIVVVADRFARFARGDRVLTLSGLHNLLAADSAEPDGGTWVVHPGQGVDATDFDLLEAAGEKSGATVLFADPDAFRRPAELPVVVHKDRAENVLLAGVHSPSAELCRAELRIHRDNELILDHHTGEHVQGIVIVEALRQICIAQFETAIRPGLAPAAYAGVWKRIDLSFEDFLFPLPATVESRIEESDLGRETNLKFRATTAVRQQGRTVATAVIDYSMIVQGRIDTLERRKADQATRAYLG